MNTWKAFIARLRYPNVLFWFAGCLLNLLFSAFWYLALTTGVLPEYVCWPCGLLSAFVCCSSFLVFVTSPKTIHP